MRNTAKFGITVITAAAGLLVACDGNVTSTNVAGTSCPAGSERCACYGNGTCDSGLACASALCVKFGVGGGGDASSLGGARGAGGAPSSGGTPNSVGGVPAATGGSPATGGVLVTGGSRGTGGGPTGGVSASGGASVSGGAPTSGGIPSTGGTLPTGGALTTGGNVASGGNSNGGGGVPSTGGSSATGGAPATGGSRGTGSTPGTCNSNVQSIGCSPGLMTETGTLSGPFGSHATTIGNKQYFLQVNEWGSTASQTMAYGGNSYFKMTVQQASVSASGAPAGYPSMFIGANSNHVTSGSGLPRQVSLLDTVLTTWNWADNGTAFDTTDIFNAAYDIWFSTNAAGDPSSSLPSGGYLMIWYHAQGCQPVGSLRDAGRTVAGVPGCWDVWTGTNGGKPTISYKHQGMVQSLGFDLNSFIKDALVNYPSYMSNSWYLTNIFTGFEIWSGGVNLESKSFCAEVN